MPRIDETSVETTNKLEEMGVDWETITFLDGNPIDLCRSCYKKYGFTDDVEHPSYDDAFIGDIYHCAYCGDELTERDN